MTILYFGVARDCSGRSSETIDCGELSVDGLWDLLIARHPELASCRAIARIAVDMRYAEGGEIVPAGAEVAVIPPVAGG